MSKKALSLILFVALTLGSAGMATAQDSDDDEADEEEDLGGISAEDFYRLGLERPHPALNYDVDADRDRSVDREVDMDEEKVFNAIALARHTGETINFGDLADSRTTERLDQSAFARGDYDEETVFAALALGINPRGGGDLEGLAAAGGEVRRDYSLERTTIQDVDLDRDDTLLAIALLNGGGGSLSWLDVASVERSTETAVNAEQDVDLTTEDAFLALALGQSWGRGGGGGDGGDDLIAGGTQ